MNFHFRLQGALIEPQEAFALLNATSSNSLKVPEIDLDKVIDIKNINSDSLFKMSVETNNSDLAALAWKVSVAQRNKKSVGVEETSAVVKKINHSIQQRSIEQIIEHIASANSYSRIGAAMLLQTASENKKTTIRKTAIHYVNKMWGNLNIPRGSKLFMGFEHSAEGLTPVIQTADIPRKETFHISPIYISLREGLLFCVKEGLLEQIQAYSVGTTSSGTKTNYPGVDKMRRVFYSISATSKGKQLCSEWGDIENYIEKAFAYHVNR
jgi:hypothetical protein